MNTCFCFSNAKIIVLDIRGIYNKTGNAVIGFANYANKNGIAIGQTISLQLLLTNEVNDNTTILEDEQVANNVLWNRIRDAEIFEADYHFVSEFAQPEGDLSHGIFLELFEEVVDKLSNGSLNDDDGPLITQSNSTENVDPHHVENRSTSTISKPNYLSKVNIIFLSDTGNWGIVVVHVGGFIVRGVCRNNDGDLD